MNAWQIFKGSNGTATQALYDRLASFGPAGVVALNLFRACKASGRAKEYTRRFKGPAYEKKNWSLGNLCKALGDWNGQPAASAGLVFPDEPPLAWGWKEDPAQSFHCWVLYVELPTGQVSFHAESPLCERRYPGEWDGLHLSAERIIRFTQNLLDHHASVTA